MALFSCVNTSVGYLMQDLTVDLISIYPKDDSGTKIQRGKDPKSHELVALENPRHRECSPQNPKRSEGMELEPFIWPQMNVTPSTKMHLKSSVATAEIANCWIYPLTPSVTPQPSPSSIPADLSLPHTVMVRAKGRWRQMCSLNGSSSVWVLRTALLVWLSVTLQNHTPLIKIHFYTTNQDKENFVCCHPESVQSLAY